MLTTAPEDLKHLWLPLCILAVAFAVGYRDLVALSFDRDHARLSGSPALLVEGLFFVGLAYVTAEAINLMGSFYTLAQMIVPALLSLMVARSLAAALALAVGYSAVTTAAGFALSLQPVRWAGTSLHLPTSSTIVLLLAAGLPLVGAATFIRRRVRQSGSA